MVVVVVSTSVRVAIPGGSSSALIEGTAEVSLRSGEPGLGLDPGVSGPVAVDEALATTRDVVA